MTFSYDLTTLIGQVRMLIGDTDATDPQLWDEELQVLINMYPDDSLYMVCAGACETLASKASMSFTQVNLSSLSINDKDRVAALHAAADKFKTLDQTAPAFAVVEEDLSDFNALQIIRNYIFRTEGGA